MVAAVRQTVMIGPGGRVEVQSPQLKEGQYTPLAETIRSFREICDGKWDHLPVAAFRYVGAVEQAEEQAKKMAR